MKVFDEIYEVKKSLVNLSLSEKEVDLLNSIGRYGETDGSIFVYVEKKELEDIAKDNMIDDNEKQLVSKLLKILPWKDGVCDLEICY